MPRKKLVLPKKTAEPEPTKQGRDAPEKEPLPARDPKKRVPFIVNHEALNMMVAGKLQRVKKGSRIWLTPESALKVKADHCRMLTPASDQ